MTQLKPIIRPPRPEDAADLYEMISDPAVNATLIHLPSKEFSSTQAWLKEAKPGQHRFVAEVDGKVVGSLPLTHYLRPRLQHGGRLGMMVHRDYWGQGIGSALMKSALDLADNWLNLKRIELEVFTDNETAVSLYKKFGFEIEGVRRKMVFGGNGRFHDEYQMSRLRPGLNYQPTPVSDPRPRTATPATRQHPVTIRPIHPDDVNDMHDLWRHPSVARTTLQMPDQEIYRAIDRLENCPPNGHRLVAVVNGRVVGSINLFQEQNPRMMHSGGFGMMVNPDYWGQGIGSRLMEAILGIADNWLNLVRVELEVHVDNPPAINLYKKFGFEIEGTKRMHTYGDGRWADTHFMSRIRETI